MDAGCGFIHESIPYLSPRPEKEAFLGQAFELRSEFFHCCILASNFASLSTVQSYLCGD